MLYLEVKIDEVICHIRHEGRSRTNGWHYLPVNLKRATQFRFGLRKSVLWYALA